MTIRDKKLIWVHLNEAYMGAQDYFFGSVSAIYDVLPPSVVGLTCKSLWGRFKNGFYRSRKALIRKTYIHSKRTQRGVRY